MTVFPFLAFDSVESGSEFSPGSVMLFESKYSLMKGGIFLKSGKWSPLLFPKPRKNRKKSEINISQIRYLINKEHTLLQNPLKSQVFNS